MGILDELVEEMENVEAGSDHDQYSVSTWSMAAGLRRNMWKHRDRIASYHRPALFDGEGVGRYAEPSEGTPLTKGCDAQKRLTGVYDRKKR